MARSLHVPMFVEDTDNSPITLLKKWVHFLLVLSKTGYFFNLFSFLMFFIDELVVVLLCFR